MHYLVTRGQVATSGLSVLHTQRIGPYALLAYRPVIDYAGWSFATGSSQPPDGMLDGRWHKLALPATNFGLVLASSSTVAPPWANVSRHVPEVGPCTFD